MAAGKTEGKVGMLYRYTYPTVAFTDIVAMKQHGASQLALKVMRNEMRRQSRKFMKVSFKPDKKERDESRRIASSAS
jgi:hypothetical protein